MSTATTDGLERLLDALARGELLGDAAIPAFSDLDRESAALLRHRWEHIPLVARQRLLAQAAALAVRDIQLDFRDLSLAAMEDPEAAIRRLAIGALWESEHRDTAVALERALRTDTDESVRAAAAAGLRRFALLHELARLDREAGDALVETLRTVALSTVEATDVRARAVEALGCRTLPWVDGLIRDCYYDEERELRMAAVVAMGESAEERWLEYLYEQMRSDDPAFRAAAVTAAALIAAEDSVDEVAALLDDEEQSVVVAAVRALGEIGGDAAAGYLHDFEERAPESAIDDLEAAVASVRGLDAEDDE